MTSPPALLIAGHGDPDASQSEAFRALVARAAARRPGVAVAGGETVPGGPSLAEAVDELAGRGVTRLTAVALTLLPGGRGTAELTEAVAAELADAGRRHPGLSGVLGRPLGPHPRVLDALEERVVEAAGGGPRTPGDRAATTVLLVGEGGTDPAGNAEVCRAARLLWEGRGFAGVEPAFVSLAAPDVASGLDRCARLGARRVVVLPYALFEGVATGRARQQAEGWALAYPSVEVRFARPVGPVEALAEAVWDHYAEVTARHDGHGDHRAAPCETHRRDEERAKDHAHVR
ncbi:sirohydrochlorin chelatase [Streptomyces sp. SAJ15]|uniref:sirohydrochlorin chelatase n=1 Tax=Streptomyces sp. SAJ15 TaxID=2011095 RepID=UPI001185FB60|nr:sirohydrochlorin chelatase [Streptomyces sp. SAJ15]TVL90747.1 cobalamin biosynthesis protein CbiX [Streptomyces sp. SAJ15]